MMGARPLALSLLAAVLLGCRAEPPAAAAPPAETRANPEYPALPDSLVLKAPRGVEVYFAGARVGTDSAGSTCMERGLVLVHEGTRTLVPLLMTGAPPILVNDTKAVLVRQGEKLAFVFRWRPHNTPTEEIYQPHAGRQW